MAIYTVGQIREALRDVPDDVSISLWMFGGKTTINRLLIGGEVCIEPTGVGDLFDPLTPEESVVRVEITSP